MRTLFKISTLPLIDIKMISLSLLANLSHLLLLPTKYNRAIIDDVSPQADENEDQNHSCPRREKKDGKAWMMPR